MQAAPTNIITNSCLLEMMDKSSALEIELKIRYHKSRVTGNAIWFRLITALECIPHPGSSRIIQAHRNPHSDLLCILFVASLLFLFPLLVFFLRESQSWI